jgi:hypothetical protein
VSKTVFILDEIVTRPGMAAAYRDAYLSRYAPGARERGMTLEYVRLSPPLELIEAHNTLHFMWSVENADAWWLMRVGGAKGRPVDTSGADKAAWWEESADMTVSRSRRIFVDFEDAGTAG